jgi:hypothetical protein
MVDAAKGKFDLVYAEALDRCQACRAVAINHGNLRVSVHW